MSELRPITTLLLMLTRSGSSRYHVSHHTLWPILAPRARKNTFMTGVPSNVDDAHGLARPSMKVHANSSRHTNDDQRGCWPLRTRPISTPVSYTHLRAH